VLFGLGGVPLGGVTSTSGDIPYHPTHPAATQSTERAGVAVPDDMRCLIGAREDQWKRYLTDDDPADVLAWYQEAMAAAGFRTGSPRESGVAVFFESDWRYTMYVTVTDGKTNVILAKGKE
jgi:hypothetical protein